MILQSRALLYREEGMMVMVADPQRQRISVEVFQRPHSDTIAAWHYQQYHAQETITLESLDIEIPVAALYEGLAIPAETED